MICNIAAAHSAIEVVVSRDVPPSYIEVVKHHIRIMGVKSQKNIFLAIGEGAFQKSIIKATASDWVVGVYLSRNSYEKVLNGLSGRRDLPTLSTLYFDPSTDALVDFAYRLKGENNKLSIVLLNSWASDDWLTKPFEGLDVRTRGVGKKFNSLLSDYKNKIFVLPADEHMMEDVDLSSLVMLLLNNGSGIVTFSPNIRNSLGSIYYEPHDYIEELVSRVTKGIPFAEYPKGEHFSSNQKVANAIGLKLK